MLDDFDNCNYSSLLKRENIDDEAVDELAGGEYADDEAADDESVCDKEPLTSIFGTYGEAKLFVKRTPMKSKVI